MVLPAEVAGFRIRASHAKISRLERGRVGFKERDVADLLTLYGITDHQQRGRFLALARRANAADWWHPYSDLLPSRGETYLGLERHCCIKRSAAPSWSTCWHRSRAAGLQMSGLLRFSRLLRGVPSGFEA